MCSPSLFERSYHVHARLDACIPTVAQSIANRRSPSGVCFRRACVNCASPEPTVFLIEGTHGLGGPMTIDTPLHAEHQLDQLAGQFAHWRQTRPRPFAPIPSALWDQAVALAAAFPPARV